MAKYSGSRSKKNQAKNTKKESKQKAKSSMGSTTRQSNMLLTTITCILLIGFITWRVGPVWGYGKALLVGLAISAVWILFMNSSIIYEWVRKR